MASAGAFPIRPVNDRNTTADLPDRLITDRNFTTSHFTAETWNDPAHSLKRLDFLTVVFSGQILDCFTEPWKDVTAELNSESEKVFQRGKISWLHLQLSIADKVFELSAAINFYYLRP